MPDPELEQLDALNTAKAAIKTAVADSQFGFGQSTWLPVAGAFSLG